LLAHDAQMDEFLDAGRIGRITIHEDCRIGHRTTVLPGVEIGPRTIVLPHSVVVKSLPPDSVCSGNPAKPVSTVEEYAARQRSERESLPNFDAEEFLRLSKSRKGREQLRVALSKGGFVSRKPPRSASDPLR